LLDHLRQGREAFAQAAQVGVMLDCVDANSFQAGNQRCGTGDSFSPNLMWEVNSQQPD